MRSANLERVLRIAVSIWSFGAATLSAGSLSGRLFDSDGRPIAGARVLAVRDASEEENLLADTEGRDPETVGETRSDPAGQFRIAFDAPGVTVALRIQATGLPEARLGEPYDSGDTVTIEDVSFPRAVKLAGKVVDDKGRPLAGARVRVASGEDADFETIFVAEARSGADGSWSIESGPEGARSIRVRADGFVPLARFTGRRGAGESSVLHRGGTVRGTVVDSAGKPVAGAIVTSEAVAARTDALGAFRLGGLPAGTLAVETEWKGDLSARKDARVTVGGEAEVALRLARAAAVAGSVVEEDTRRPIAGARITVREASGSPFDFGSGGRRGRADARGRFRVGGLPAGRYRVEAEARGHLPSSVPGARAAVPEGPALAIALRKECSIAGRVVDEAGKPVPGARVAIPRELGMRRLMRLGRGAFRTAETRTAPDGTFSLRRLGPEPGITLEATKSGYAAGRKTGIRLKNGEALKGVSLVLRQGLVARGRVVDAEGRPIAGAEVRSARAERGRRGNFAFVRGFGQEEKPDAVSVADGGFVLRGLEAARYQVSASKEGLLAKAPATVDVVEKGENEIPPIVLEAGVAIAGAVRNVKGEPVPDAQIFVASEGSPPPGSTDPNGRFRIAGLPSGRPVMFFVSAPGYAQRQSNATPPAENLTITLDTAATVRGRVEDAESKSPLSDFSISRSESSSGGGGMVIRFGNAREARSFHAGDGSFELPDVPPGRWTFRAEAAGYRAAEVSGVEVAAGETKEGIVLSLKRGGSLSGRVIESARGAPVANASVSWRASGGGAGFGFRFGPDAQQQTTSDADGRFSFDSLPEGKITLEASHPDYVEGSLEVDPGKQSAVEISLGTGGSIAGTVVGSDGRMPAAGAQVLLDTQGESGRFGGNEATTADGSGAFLFDHLQAGRYQLVAQGNAGTSAPKEVVLADNQRADGVVLQTATGTLLRGTVSGLPAAAFAGVRIFASSASYSDGATTDAEGRFTILDVPSGVLRVTASTSSFVQGRTAQTTVEVPDGVPEFPVEIVFEGTSRLSGQVTRAGRPLSGLFVSATPDPPAGGGRSSGQTDGDGRYDLEGLSDGPYEVSVQGQGVGYRKSFQISGDTNGDIALPGTSLSGTVRDESGQPIDGADVQAETGQETQAFSVKRGVTDSNGSYSIEDLDPGNYRVTARKTGYRLDTEPATVGSDPASLDFTLKKGTGLSIRVADGQTGIPLTGVQALAFAADGTVAYQGRIALGADGTGEVPSLSDGAYTLYVFSDGYAARSLPVNVPSSPVLLAMTPGGRVEVRTSFSVSGRLLDAGGGMVLLSPWRLDGTLTAAAPVSAWEHLAPGSYQWISGDGAGRKSTPFAVTEGQTTRIDLK